MRSISSSFFRSSSEIGLPSRLFLICSICSINARMCRRAVRGRARGLLDLGLEVGARANARHDPLHRLLELRLLLGGERAKLVPHHARDRIELLAARHRRQGFAGPLLLPALREL